MEQRITARPNRSTRRGRRTARPLLAAAPGAALLTIALAACAEADQRPAASPAVTGTPSASGTAALADGEFTAKGWYGGGPSSVDVTVTLEGGDVTAVEVVPNATNETSLDYQQRFASGIGERVVGRPLAEIGDVVVSGASSTAGGYDDAVRQIREEASGG